MLWFSSSSRVNGPRAGFSGVGLLEIGSTRALGHCCCSWISWALLSRWSGVLRDGQQTARLMASSSSVSDSSVG